MDALCENRVPDIKQNAAISINNLFILFDLNCHMYRNIEYYISACKIILISIFNRFKNVFFVIFNFKVFKDFRIFFHK